MGLRQLEAPQPHDIHLHHVADLLIFESMEVHLDNSNLDYPVGANDHNPLAVHEYILGH